MSGPALTRLRDRLLELHAEARQHGEWIDSNEPEHPFSGQSAASRGNHSVFEQLAATCAAVRARLKSENLTRK